ncbi:unnamed protein product, partial [Candidula unifasciata]
MDLFSPPPNPPPPPPPVVSVPSAVKKPFFNRPLKHCLGSSTSWEGVCVFFLLCAVRKVNLPGAFITSYKQLP